MAIEYMTAIWKLKLDPTIKFIFITLADCANHEGECFPSISYLCSRTGYHERTVQKAILKLVELNYLDSDKQLRKNGSSTVNKYKIIGVFQDVRETPYPGPVPPPPRSTTTPYNHHLDPSLESKEKDLSVFNGPQPFVSFHEFKKIYPRKEKMAKDSRAERLWNKLQPQGDVFKIIELAIEAQDKKRRNQAKNSIDGWHEDWPMAETWLNQRRWEDEVYDPDIESDKLRTKRLDAMKEKLNKHRESKVNGYAGC